MQLQVMFQVTFRPSRVSAHAALALLCAISWQTSAAQTAATAPVPAPVPVPALAAANPTASVPSVSYRSVFKETSLGVEKDSADWRKANAEVGKFLRGHVDILKWEEQESANAMKQRMEKPMVKPTVKPMDPATQAPNLARPDATKPIAAPAHKH